VGDHEDRPYRGRIHLQTAISPYLTLHIKRFGEYILDLVTRPQPLSSVELAFSL